MSLPRSYPECLDALLIADRPGPASTRIRPFTDHHDALQAVTEAGFQLLSHRMRNTAFNPRTCFRHPDTGEVCEVLWNHDRGQVNRLPGPADAVSPIPMEVMP